MELRIKPKNKAITAILTLFLLLYPLEGKLNTNTETVKRFYIEILNKRYKGKSKRAKHLKKELENLRGESFLYFINTSNRTSQEHAFSSFAGLVSALEAYREITDENIIDFLKSRRIKTKLLYIDIINKIMSKNSIAEGEFNRERNEITLFFKKEPNIENYLALTNASMHEFSHVLFYPKGNFDREIYPLTFQMLFALPLKNNKYSLRIPQSEENHYSVVLSYCIALKFYEENKELFYKDVSKAKEKLYLFFKELEKNPAFQNSNEFYEIISNLEDFLYRFKLKNFKKKNLFISYYSIDKKLIEKFYSELKNYENGSFEERAEMLKRAYSKFKEGKMIAKEIEKVAYLRKLFKEHYEDERIEYLFKLILDYLYDYPYQGNYLYGFLAKEITKKYPPAFREYF